MRRNYVLMLAALVLVPLFAYAAVTVTVNGSNYSIPQSNERGWGTNVTTWIQAISANTLQPSGGTFSLTADTNFGANYGLVSTYFKSRTSNISTSGVLRLANSDSIGFRNAANGGNLLLGVNGSDQLTFNGATIATGTAGSFQDSTFELYDNSDSTKKLNFQLSGVSAGNTRTLTVPDYSGTLATLAGTETLTNKTLTSPVINSPTGIVKADVGLGNVDNTSDATKNAASVTLTNKTIDGDDNTVQDFPVTAIKTVLADADKVLTRNASGVPQSSLIVNANVDASAAIARSKLASGTASHVLINDGSGVMSSESALAITRGGTGQTTANAALNALLPSQTSNTNKVLKTDGTNTSWGSVGGGTGKNYAQDLYDGSSVTGINTYADAAATTPVDGTGGSPSVSAAALNSSTPLRGTSSQRLSKGATNRQGDGWSYDFTLDAADYEGGKPVIVSFRYKTSANYASGDVRMFVYDRDGSTLLNVISLTGDGSINASTNTTRYTGTFYPNSSNNDYRLIFHVTSTNASAWDLDLIDLSIGPDQVVPGAIITEWQSFTPTGAWSTNTTYTGLWRRVGTEMELQYQIALGGAPTSANLTLNLPTGYTIDTARLINSTAGYEAVGQGFAHDNGVSSYPLLVGYNSTSTLGVYVSNTAGTYATNGGAVTQAVPFTFGNSDAIIVTARVPITNWLPSAALTTTETMLASAVVVGSKNTGNHSSTGNWQDVSFTESVDNLNAFDGTTFTAPRKMRVAVHGVVGFALNSTGVRAVRVTNASSTVYFVGNQDTGSASRTNNMTFTGILNLAAGDTIRIQAYQNSGGNLNYDTGTGGSYISISEIPDFSIFSTYGTTELLPATGYSSSGLTNYVITASQYGDLDSESLPPGEYDLTATATFYSNGATTTDNIGIGLSTTSGNSATGLVEGDTINYTTKTTTSGSRNSVALTVRGVVVTTPTTYYLKGFAGTSITNLQIGWTWRFRRVK